MIINIGDKVTFCAYPEQIEQDIKAKVVDIIEEGGRTFYRLRGDVISTCLGANIKEHPDFEGFRKAFDIINKGGYEFNHFQSGYITPNLFEYQLIKGGESFHILVRVEQQIAELFNSKGYCVK